MTLALVQRFDTAELEDTRDKLCNLAQSLAGNVLSDYEVKYFEALSEPNCYVTSEQLSVIHSILARLVDFEQGTLFKHRELALQSKTILRKIAETSAVEVANNYTEEEIRIALTNTSKEWDTAARVAEECTLTVEKLLSDVQLLELELRNGHTALRGGLAFVAALSTAR